MFIIPVDPMITLTSPGFGNVVVGAHSFTLHMCFAEGSDSTIDPRLEQDY